MRLVESLRAFGGPVDERVRAEMNRVYKTGFWILAVGLIVYQYYGYWKSQVEWAYGLVDSPHAHEYVDPFVRMLFFAAFVVIAFLMYRRGLPASSGCGDSGGSSVAVCLTGAAVAGFAVGALTAAVRFVAQCQMLGFERMRPLDDAVIGVVMGLQAGLLVFLVLLAYYHLAKRRIAKLEENLDDE